MAWWIPVSDYGKSRVLSDHVGTWVCVAEPNVEIEGGIRGRSASPKKQKASEPSSNLPDIGGSQASLQHQGNFHPSPRSRDSSATCAGTEGYVPSLLSDCCTSEHALPSVTHN